MANHIRDKKTVLAGNRSDYSAKELRALSRKELKYEDSTQFLHCQDCLSKFLESSQHSSLTPRDAMEYEVSMVPLEYPDGVTIGVIAVWCKRCGKRVWDSRHLTNMY